MEWISFKRIWAEPPLQGYQHGSADWTVGAAEERPPSPQLAGHPGEEATYNTGKGGGKVGGRGREGVWKEKGEGV